MFNFWSPKVLKCQIYEDNVLVDLSKLHGVVLEGLVHAIYPLWRTSPESTIWYGVEVYKRKSIFDFPHIEIDIEAYIRDDTRMFGRRQISINKTNIGNKIGRKIRIQPNDTLIKKWSDNVEVAFVV